MISFGLTNAIAEFMDLINRMFRPDLDSFVIVFIDYLLIYSRRREDHKKHLRIVLHTLRDQCLYTKFSKCEFLLESIALLGHVFNNGILIDLTKNEVVFDWTRLIFVASNRICKCT